MPRHDSEPGGPSESGGDSPDGDSADDLSDDDLPDDVVADLLASDRRRRILECLDAADGPVPIVDLARQVLAREEDAPVDDLDDDAVRVVRDDIYHVHLPKLTATGVVTFDSLVGTVALAVDDERLFESTGTAPADGEGEAKR